MKSLTLVTLVLASLCALISAKTEPLAATASVPFQLISPVEYKAILDLNNGNPFITQNRLLNSGSEVVTDIINNIVNGLISPVNISGLDPTFNSLLKPSSGKAQGYPFCAIQTNRNNKHSQRSYDAVVDPASNFGTFSINFYHPGTVNIDSYDEDISTDELEPDYPSQKPSSSHAESGVPSLTMANKPPTTTAHANKDKPDNSLAPVINCIVVLKEPSKPATPPPTTTPTPITSTHRPSKHPFMRPSFYPQYPTILTPPNPQDPSYSIGPYQVVPIPYPPFLGLLGPSASSSGTSNWPHWAGSQSYPSNNPHSAIPPSWPYWPLGSPSLAEQAQFNKNPQTAPESWPYLAIPSQPASTQVPTTATSPYIPSSFWTALNPDVGHAVPSPSISVHSNQAAWYRPPAGALNHIHLLQQQQQQQQQHQQHYYNENADEIRSARDDETATENKHDNQVEPLIGVENIVGAIQHSQKQQSRRMRMKSKI